MKKLTILLLVLSLCVALVSCGQSAPKQKKIHALCEKKGANITCLIRISINPEFELIVDDLGTVCDVIRRNDDAEKVFAQATDIVMKSYDEAVEELLTAAKNSGYLTDKSTVSVTVIVREDCAYGDAVISAVDETVREFVGAEQCDVDVWDGRGTSVPPQKDDDENADDGNDSGNSAQNPKGVEVRDAKGKLVSRTTETQTPEGIRKTTDYFDANEKLTKRVEELDSKITVSEYDADGHCISLVWEDQTPEGPMKGAEYFDANGNKTKEEIQENGFKIVNEFDANGRIVSAVQEFINLEGVPETRTSTFSYHESGKLATDYTHSSDGSYTETYYYENGNEERFYRATPDGGYVDASYDESGNMILTKRKFMHDSGAYGLWTDYPDGTSEEYFHEIDGSVWYSWFDAEGFQHGTTRVQ